MVNRWMIASHCPDRNMGPIEAAGERLRGEGGWILCVKEEEEQHVLGSLDATHRGRII